MMEGITEKVLAKASFDPHFGKRNCDPIVLTEAEKRAVWDRIRVLAPLSGEVLGMELHEANSKVMARLAQSFPFDDHFFQPRTNGLDIMVEWLSVGRKLSVTSHVDTDTRLCVWLHVEKDGDTVSHRLVERAS